MLKRRLTRNTENDHILPSTTASLSPTTTIDGSGRSIHTEAPILRAAKNASSYTRKSYIWAFSSLFLVIYCWRAMWYHYATTFLECYNEDDGDGSGNSYSGPACTLKIITPHRGNRLTLKIDREQIVKSMSYKVTEDGERQNGDGYGSGSGSGSDVKLFDSYGIVLNQYGKNAAVDPFEVQREKAAEAAAAWKRNKGNTERMELMQKYGSAVYTDPDLRKQLMEQEHEANEAEQQDASAGAGADAEGQKIQEAGHAAKKQQMELRNYNLPNLDPLQEYATREAEGQYLLTMRRYNVGHKRRRVASLVNKVNLYANGTKDRLIIRENRNVVWQGILGMILGIFSFLLSLLLGQFSEPQKKKTRGPGSRRKLNATSGYGNGNGNAGHHGYGSNNVASIPRSSRQSQSRQASYRPKAYGGYVPGKNSYSY